MKILVVCLFAVSFAGLFNPAFSQTKTAILRGKILTDSKTPSDETAVVLLNAVDSAVVRSAITNKAGQFNFNDIIPGNYLVFATKFNYNKSYTGPYSVVAGKTTDVGNITLKQGTTQLREVSITGKKDFVEVRADKTVLNVEQNIMATGASLFEVLSTAPGVKVTDEDVLYRGGQRAMIAINNKPVLLTGEELISLLKNYQGNTISQIELIDNPAAKYGAAGGGGMINIILKKNKDLGSSISVTQSAAGGDKYKFNTSINYNLRTEKLNIFAGYNYANTSVPHSINTNRVIDTGGSVYRFNLDYYADAKASNNNFSVGADYKLTPRQTIGFLVNGYDNNSTIDKRSTTTITTNNVADSSIKTQSTIKRDIYNLNYNLNYTAELGKSGKSTLSADVDYSNFHRQSDELLQNDFFNAAGGVSSNPIFYTDHSPSHITIRSENIDFSQALSKNSSIEAGVKNSQVKSDNMIDFEQKVDTLFLNVPNLTDHFVYNERINAAYVKFDTRFGTSTLSASLRAEQTSYSARSVNPSRVQNSSYFNFFPNLQITHELDKNNQLTAFYARNINRPNYQDLNPFIGYVDDFYYTTGNSFLKPSYINTYQVSDLYLKKYKVALNMIVTNDYYNVIFQQNDSTKRYTTSKVNLGTRYQYMADFNIPVDIANWWNINADINVFHERYVYNTDTIARKNTNGLILTLNQNFKLSSKLTAQLTGDYETPTYYVISQFKTSYYLNAGLSYSILHNEGKIRLAFSDILNSDYLNRYHTNYANLDLTGREKIGSRFIQASFTYHFGNVSQKARAAKDNSDEQKRLGSSSNEN